MSFPRVAVFGVFPLFAALAAACGNTTESNQTSGTTGGSTSTTTSSSTTGTGGSTSTTTTSSSSSSGDGAEGTPSTDYPAPFPAPPQVVDFGGPVLASPKFVPVFFSNDDPTMVSQIVGFVAQVGATAVLDGGRLGVRRRRRGRHAHGLARGDGAGHHRRQRHPDLARGQAQRQRSGLARAGRGHGLRAPLPGGHDHHLPGRAGGSSRAARTSAATTRTSRSSGGTNVAYAVIPRCQAFGGMSLHRRS